MSYADWAHGHIKELEKEHERLKQINSGLSSYIFRLESQIEALKGERDVALATIERGQAAIKFEVRLYDERTKKYGYPLRFGRAFYEGTISRLRAVLAEDELEEDTPKLRRLLSEPAPWDPPTCTLCNVPLATGDCPHLLEVDDERVAMSLKEYGKIAKELSRLRTMEAKLADSEPDRLNKVEAHVISAEERLTAIEKHLVERAKQERRAYRRVMSRQVRSDAVNHTEPSQED